VKKTRPDCIIGARAGLQPPCTISEKDRFSPSLHFGGPQAIPVIFSAERAPLDSPRVSTCSRDASTQAALLGVQSAFNN
jgi:hypothetical protein